MAFNLSILIGAHSEKDSVPLFIRRYCSDRNTYINTEKPFRVTEGELKKQETLVKKIEGLIEIYGRQPVLIFFDADNEVCPKEFIENINVVLSMKFPDIRIFIAIAKWETETWFIPAIESLRGIHGIPMNARTINDMSQLEEIDAKQWLSGVMEKGRVYIETVDQPAFIAQFDYKVVAECEHARSFRHFLKALDEILELCAEKSPE